MSGQAFQLRLATEADLDAIMALESSIFANDAWSSESMLRELTSRHCYYLVAARTETPDRIEGYAGLLAPRGSKDADIQTIAVAPAARRLGLGRSLVLALLAEAAARRAVHVFLEVRADNPGAQKLYLELGFDQIGVRRGYYQPDNVDAFVMRRSVASPVPNTMTESAR